MVGGVLVSEKFQQIKGRRPCVCLLLILFDCSDDVIEATAAADFQRLLERVLGLFELDARCPCFCAGSVARCLCCALVLI